MTSDLTLSLTSCRTHDLTCPSISILTSYLICLVTSCLTSILACLLTSSLAVMYSLSEELTSDLPSDMTSGWGLGLPTAIWSLQLWSGGWRRMRTGRTRGTAGGERIDETSYVCQKSSEHHAHWGLWSLKPTLIVADTSHASAALNTQKVHCLVHMPMILVMMLLLLMDDDDDDDDDDGSKN